MKKRIKLETNSGRLLDREPFLMAENEALEIEIMSDYSTSFIVSMKNGVVSTQISATGNFTVPVCVVVEGMLEIEISMYARGELVKRWHVEPIRIIKHEGEFVWHPILDEINSRLEAVQALTVKVEQLEARLQAVESTVDEVSDIVQDPLN